MVFHYAGSFRAFPKCSISVEKSILCCFQIMETNSDDVVVKYLRKSGTGFVFPVVEDISSAAYEDLEKKHVRLDRRRYHLL